MSYDIEPSERLKAAKKREPQTMSFLGRPSGRYEAVSVTTTEISMYVLLGMSLDKVAHALQKGAEGQEESQRSY